MASTVTHLAWGSFPVAPAPIRRSDKTRTSRDAMESAAANGDTSAFEQLYQQSAPRVLKTLYRITRNREDAEDALQEAFLSAFLHARDFDGRSSFSTWFTRIAINSALMILRKKRTHPEQSIDGAGADGNERHWVMPETATSPEKLYAQSEQAGLLKAAVGDLRPAIRKVVE